MPLDGRPEVEAGEDRYAPGVIRRGRVTALATAAALAISGCAAGPQRGEPGCAVGDLRVTPAVTARGSTIAVTSDGYRCTRGKVTGTEHVAVALPPGPVLADVTVPVRSDGSFRAELSLPSTSLQGHAVVTASEATQPQCKQGTCAAYIALLTIAG